MIDRPWLLDSSQVSVEYGFSAKIVSEDDCYYGVEFRGKNGSVVESKIKKKEFLSHPEKPCIGYLFGLICFRLKGQEKKISVWPVKRFWNMDLR